MADHLSQGTLLLNGKYRIVRFIKSGGFGCTYEAENTYFEERVAIKEFFVRDFCNRDENTAHITVGTQSKKDLVGKLKSKFIAEAKALYKLKHPGIVHVSDVFEENGTAYYVMDYIDGCSLDVYLQQMGPLPEAEALGYIRQVCEALKYVHAQNRLHLDLKPGNVMLAKDSGKAILIDFGTAKQYDECSGENTSTLLGSTPGYAPPEQTNAKVTQFFPATDIYSLGATLYKLLTGVTPLTASERSSGEELDPLPEYVSEPTRRAIEQALLLPKLKRPQSIDDFLKILDADSQAGEEVVLEDIGTDDSESDTTEIYGKDEPVPEGEVIADEETGNGDDEDAYDKTLVQSDSDEQPDSQGSSDYPSQQSGPVARPKKIFRSWVWLLLVALILIGVGIFVDMSSQFDGNERQTIYPIDPQSSSSDVSLTGTHQGYEWVDLGLSVKWATCNVGASSPGDYGTYYAWGEISTKSSYRDGNCASYGSSASKWDNIGGKSAYDAARANWKGSWRLPTKAEFQELIDYCDWTWTTQNGHKGYKVTSKKNNQSIFLPAAGCRDGGTLGSDGVYGYYWSSTPNESSDSRACSLYFYEGRRHVLAYRRYYGRSVRPVLED